MPQFQTANILVALGGDHGSTVPKYSVTAPEIAVLRLIHGEDAVLDVEPLGVIESTHRAERARLCQTYYRIINGERRSPQVDELFPGAAARLFEAIEELELDPSMFKASARMKPVAAPVAEPDDEADEPVKPKRGRKKAEAPAPAPVAEADDEDNDGIADMPDASSVLG